MHPKETKFVIPLAKRTVECLGCLHSFSSNDEEQKAEPRNNSDPVVIPAPPKRQVLTVSKSAQLFAIYAIVAHDKSTICNTCFDLPIEDLADKILMQHSKIVTYNKLNESVKKNLFCNVRLRHYAEFGFKTKQNESRKTKEAWINANTIGKDRFQHLAAWSKEQLTNLSGMIVNYRIANNEELTALQRSKQVAIIVTYLFYFFFKCCIGASWVKMGALSNVNGETFKTYFEKGMNYINLYLKPHYLGSTAFPMNVIENEHLSEAIDGIDAFQQVRCTLDCTYVYFGAPFDMDLSWLSFSKHKQRNLLKLLFSVLNDGM